MKLLVLGPFSGDTPVGKTQLINRLVGNPYEQYTQSQNQPSWLQTTIQNIKFEICKIPARDQFSLLIRMSSQGKDIVLYCVDLSATLNVQEIHDHIKDLKRYTNHARIFLVGTKWKEEQHQDNQSQLQAIHATLVKDKLIHPYDPVFVTSAESDHNIDTLRAHILLVAKAKLREQQAHPLISKPSFSWALRLLCGASPVLVILLILAAGFGIGCAVGSWQSPAAFGAAFIHHSASALSILAVSLFSGAATAGVVATQSQTCSNQFSKVS